MTLRSLVCKCVCISVSVGYEYESCPGLIQWERRTALMHGFELVPSNLGGWSLDKNHALNMRSGEKWLLVFWFVVFGAPFLFQEVTLNVSFVYPKYINMRIICQSP